LSQLTVRDAATQELKPSGDVAEVAYAGFYPSGTVFRFLGFVTQLKLLSFWVATKTRDNEFLEASIR